MPVPDNDARKPTPKSHTSPAGLVVIIIVLVILLLGSAAAYFLIRRNFAKQRGNVTPVTPASGSRGAEEGKQDMRDPEILQTTREKEAWTKVRQRSVGGAIGDEDKSSGNRTERGVEKDETWI
ncbi:hypothetical protein F4859DRAFT_524189 [Xylaria cf. heliscus]|nr:hypothetical protein F4859DRAFT_524189 [Xylaria cf. heliscus]